MVNYFYCKLRKIGYHKQYKFNARKLYTGGNLLRKPRYKNILKIQTQV
jgi:hypothetical protein